MVFMRIVGAFALLNALVTARQCQNITVPVTISARNGNFNIKTPANNIEAADFILNLARQGHNYTQESLAGYSTISGTYNLATTFCAPNKGAGSTVQILTHGIGFDRSYWDLPYNNYNYSYNAVAVDDYGFSTFSWDRLGVGMSDKGDPLQEIQASLELAALAAVTKMIREGTIPGVPKFQKVTHVGHSFGSILSYGLGAQDPTASDGIVLTGFSQNGTFLADFQFGGNFISANTLPSAASLPNGYFAAGDATAVQLLFFSPGSFPPDLLQYAFMNGQPVTVGELLTVGGPSGGPSNYAGPVLIVTGERDVPFCGGDCLITGNPALPNIPSSSRQLLAQANPFEVYIVPGAGHGLNLEYSHPITYNQINQFLTGNVGNGQPGNGWKDWNRH